MKRRTRLSHLLFALLGPGTAVLAQSAAGTPVSFTSSQAAAGKEAYGLHCASCHGADLEGVELAPALAGERFALEWAGKGAGDLFAHVRRMPMPPIGKPGSLSAETYADILAFLLQSNGVAAGATALPADATVLADLVIPRTRAARGRRPPRRRRALGSPRVSLKDLPPVTDQTLRAPSPEDWPIWRRTYDSMGFSPLREIDREQRWQARARLARAARRRREHGLAAGVPRVMYLHTLPRHHARARRVERDGAVEPSLPAEDEVEQEDGHRAPRRPGVRAHLRSPPARARRSDRRPDLGSPDRRRSATGASSSSCGAVRWWRATT